MTLLTQFFLITHHPTRRRADLQGYGRPGGLVAAALLDLIQNGNLVLQRKYLMIQDIEQPTPSPLHQLLLEKIILRKKPRRFKTWIIKFCYASYFSRWKRMLETHLQTENLIDVENKRFLFFKYTKTTLIATEFRAQRLRQLYINYQTQQLNEDDLSLLMLVHSCFYHRALVSTRRERRHLRRSLRTYFKSEAIQPSIRIISKEVESGITSMVAASM